MNIIYVANLSKNKWAGPNNSVPAQVKAQSKVDNVLLYNQNHIEIDKWREFEWFLNLNDYPERKLEKLPYPFNKPDLVIFEGMYQFRFNKFVKSIRKHKVPYIIIPRSELTQQAQKQKKIKKYIANKIYFKNFIKNAVAIQYLTESEYMDSGSEWNKNNIIIPNAVCKKYIIKSSFSNNSLKLLYIGRLDLYHKGLDLMIEAIGIAQNDLRNNKAIIHLYGPDRNDTVAQLKKSISANGIDDIVFIHESVFDDAKEGILLDSDVFIMTSRFEGHPMGLIEALSYGLPCLVTMGTNMGEEIEKADAGWTAETDVESIRMSIIKLLKNKEILKTKSKNALKLSFEYDWDKLAEESSKKYETLLKNKLSKT